MWVVVNSNILIYKEFIIIDGYYIRSIYIALIYIILLVNVHAIYYISFIYNTT